MRFLFFFFKQKTAYEMRISDWSSDVCSSDLRSVHQCIIIGRRFVERDALLIEHMLNLNPALEPLALGLQPREQAQRRNSSEDPTSELQSPMCISYAAFCSNNKIIRASPRLRHVYSTRANYNPSYTHRLSSCSCINTSRR